jgi:hypothetical protein
VVQAISGAHALLNCIRCSGELPPAAPSPGGSPSAGPPPAADLIGFGAPAPEAEAPWPGEARGAAAYADVLGDRGVVALAFSWLGKYKHIDVAVSAVFWLTSALLRTPANMARLATPGAAAASAGGGEGGAGRLPEVLGSIIEATALHAASEQVMEGAVLTLLAAAEHGGAHDASALLAKEVGVGWCLQGLQHSGHPAAIGLKDALGRLCFRMVRADAGAAFVANRGLLRLVDACLACDKASAALSREGLPASPPRAADGAPADVFGGVRPEDAAAAGSLSVVDYDTRAGEGGELTYVYEVFRGEERVYHLAKTYDQFCELDKRLRRRAAGLGLALAPLPSRWTFGKADTFVGERRQALQKYLWAALIEPGLRTAPSLLDFLADSASPLRPELEESYLFGVAAAVLATLHHPPNKQPLVPSDAAEFVGKVGRTMRHNVGSELVQRVWAARPTQTSGLALRPMRSRQLIFGRARSRRPRWASCRATTAARPRSSSSRRWTACWTRCTSTSPTRPSPRSAAAPSASSRAASTRTRASSPTPPRSLPAGVKLDLECSRIHSEAALCMHYTLGSSAQNTHGGVMTSTPMLTGHGGGAAGAHRVPLRYRRLHGRLRGDLGDGLQEPGGAALLNCRLN